MRRPRRRILAPAALAFGVALLATAIALPSQAAGKGKAKAEPLPPAPARLWVVAPSPRGPWLLRIDNESAEPMRIPADVRLLRLEVRPLEKPKWAKRSRWARRPKICDGPSAFGLERKFPARRELVLEPGQSYVEQFDPRLLCFGKKADLLKGGALVRASFGWKPKPKWSRRPPRPPFAADTAKRPRHYAPLRRLEAPTMLLSFGEPFADAAGTTGMPEAGPEPTASADAKGAAGPEQGSPPTPGSTAKGDAGGATPGATPSAGGAAPKGAGDRSGHRRLKYRPKRVHDKLPVPDELAARLALSTSHYADARHGRNVVVTVTTKNEGERTRKVALRRRQLSFTVLGPDGVRKCERRSVSHVIPPDLFRTLGDGGKVSMRVRLAELCPQDTFRRPGVYVATPTLHALDTDREGRLDVLTGVVSSKKPKARKPGERPAEDPGDHQDATLVRVTRGADPFYSRPPVVIPTQFFHVAQ